MFGELMNVVCPTCNKLADVAGSGEFICPHCATRFSFAAPTPPPIPAPIVHTFAIGRRNRLRETSPGGIAIEVFGLLLCLTIVGAIIGIPLMIAGANMATSYRCSECGNRIERQSRICPTCRADLV
jgi:predicted amidophosphoribosyltransferase